MSNDPYWSNTKLLLHGESIVDSSASANALTPTGSTSTPYTSISKYGGSSIRFDGASVISIPSSSDFQFGTGDFTWEAWVYLLATPTYQGIFSIADTSGSNNNFTFGIFTKRLCYTTYVSGSPTFTMDGGDIPTSGWHHVALSRQGTTLMLFLDGYVVSYRVISGSDSFGALYSVYIGGGTVSTSLLTGYIDDLRISKGIARYPMSPPAFTLGANDLSSGDPYWSNVVFADAFNESDGTTSFTDVSGHYTITNYNGVASASNLTAKYGSTSLKFSGSPGGLMLNDTFAWMHDGATPWTFETWINVASAPSVVWGLFGNFYTNAAGNDPYIQIYIAPTGSQVFVICILSGQGTSGSGGYMLVATPAITVGTWKHVVFEYDGATLRTFLDGVLTSTCTKNGVGGSGTSYSPGTNGIVNAVIGAYSNGSFSFPMPGYIDDMRITKNVARYKSQSFIPPTQALPEGATVVSGMVLDSTGQPCSRVVNVHSRADGHLIGSATSDPTTGAFSIGSTELCYAVALDSTGNYNSLILDRLDPL